MYLRDDGSTYTRKEIFVKLDVTFRDRMLKVLKGPPLSVFLCISLHCDESMTAFPSVTTIENETGYSRPAVLAALDFLIQQAGLVERQYRQKASGEADSNLYTIRGFFTMGSKPDLPGVANVVSYPQLTSLATVANDVSSKKKPSKKIPSEEDIEDAPDGAGADAPTPAPPAKAPPSRKEKEPTARARDIPAAMIYHDLTRRWPPRVVWDRLRLIANGGLARWGETVKAWLAVGWNPGNLAGMLDCYDRGELPGTRRPERGKLAAVSQAEDDAAWAQIQAHIAEREREREVVHATN